MTATLFWKRGAVGPDRAVAVAAAEFHGDVRKQGLNPELHGNAGGDDHGDSRTKRSQPQPA